jgi:hypothetical protein
MLVRGITAVFWRGVQQKVLLLARIRAGAGEYGGLRNLARSDEESKFLRAKA